ncbi:MAG: PIG-L family deacetylase [Calditrichales bacterium]|nr:PIG-L family deacetylase [Calditrichales bacterium]
MKILVISAHPDDETLGAGGTLLKHKQKGDKIFWFIASSAFHPVYSKEVIKAQKKSVQKMADLYGISRLFWPRLPTTALDQIGLNKIIEPLREVVSSVNPEWIYTVGNHDVHSDHSALFSALMTTIKSFNTELNIKRIMSYEILSSTDVYPAARSSAFIPTVYSDITPFLDQKLKVMAELPDQLHNFPLPRSLDSIKALARYRGSIIGVEYAEAFNLIFEKF